MDSTNPVKTRKRRTKPRISELDAQAVNRRRAQVSAAQRAYRQRKDHTIESLNAQVTNLQGVMTSLNSCFLALRDTVVSSQWIQHDPQASKEVKRIVHEFLRIRKIDEASSHEAPGSRTQGHGRELTTSPVDADNGASFGLSKNLNNVGVKLAEDAGLQAYPLGYTFAAEIPPYHEPSARNNCGSEVTRTALGGRLCNPARHPRVSVPRAVSPPSEMRGILPQTFPDIDNGDFAQRLHVSCVRAAYKLAREAGGRSEEFQRVFHVHRLFRTREILEDARGKILWKNLDHLLEAPPEPDLEASQDVKDDGQLLNASEVAAFYRKKGYVVDRNSDSLIREKANDQIQGDVWLDLDNINDFSISTTYPMNEEQSRNEPTQTVNITKLIDELIAGAQCLGKRPGFRRDTLDDAVMKAAS